MGYCAAIFIVINIILSLVIIELISRLFIWTVINQQNVIKNAFHITLNKRLNLKELINNKIDEFDLEKELAPYLSVKLEDVMKQLAKQVPMGEFMLAGALGQKIKIKMQSELISQLPEIKEHLKTKILQGFNTEEIIKSALDNLEFTNFYREISQFIKPFKTKMQLLASFLGFTFGIIQVILFYWFC